MRVLHVMASGARGGGSDHLYHLIRELSALGVESLAAVGSDGPLGERLASLGAAVHPLELMHSRADPRGVAQLAALVRRVAPALVHWHGTRAGFYGALARPLLPPRQRPSVYTAHGLSYRQDASGLRKLALLGAECLAARSADRVIAVSRADREDLLRRRFVAPSRVLHVSNAADTDRFHPGGRDGARARLGLDGECFVVGTVSRLVPGKAVSDLVQAAALLPTLTLLIVGDGPERAELELQARPLGGRVRFLGARDDVPEILRALDVFALPSRWEGEPIALLEAMATGLPCVATATVGAREVLEAARAGVLVPVGSPVALASAFQELEAAPFHRAQWGRSAREAALSRSWSAVAERTRGVYVEVLHPGAPE